MDWPWLRKRTPQKEREYIEQVAYELYQNRQALGRAGDYHSDGETARKIVQSRLRTTLFAINQPLLKLEKQLWEPVLAWADNQALLSLLGIIGNAGIILALFTFIGTEKQRRDAEVLNAWQTLTSAYGQSGSGGRIQALEFLNASPGANWRRRVICLWLCTWPAESLDGINLGVEPLETLPPGNQLDDPEEEEATEQQTPRAYLRGIQLPNARLTSANLQAAYLESANLQAAHLWYANLQAAYLESANLQAAILESANLQDAILWRANLQTAYLKSANLQAAYLESANLQDAILWQTNLQAADLRSANLQAADLRSANLQDADLRSANLQDAYLESANLQGADLESANLQDAILIATDLRGTRNLRSQQLTGENSPSLCNVALPDALTDIDPNRDCKTLLQVLAERYSVPLESVQQWVQEVMEKQWD